MDLARKPKAVARRPGWCVPTAMLAAMALALSTATFAWGGALTQKPGTASCISEHGMAGGKRGVCRSGKALKEPEDVVVSPDGKNVYVTAQRSDSIAVLKRNRATGTLTQKHSRAGCVSEYGGGCEDGTALKGTSHLAVSPDGKSVYVTSIGAFGSGTSAVSIFDRNRATGALTQKHGRAGCVSENGTKGACKKGTTLTNPWGITISPDGKNVYVANADSIAVFDRNRATGALTQKHSRAGCVSENGTKGACGDGKGLENVLDIAVSPDGKQVYATSIGSNAVSIFDRDPATGALVQKPGTAGCISRDGTGGACQLSATLALPEEVAVSSDGKNVYVTNSSGVSIFDRDPVTGALTQKPSPAGCISADEIQGTCQSGSALKEAGGLAISPDGTNVYVASGISDSVAVLDRDLSTGGLTQEAGTAGCVSQSGKGCTRGRALRSPDGITVSPDGQNLYVASGISEAVSILDR